MSEQPPKREEHLLTNTLIEIGIYAVLVVVYFFLVLRFLANPLNNLFHSSLLVYGIASLGLVVMQGVVLEAITTWLLERVRRSRA